MPKEILIIDDMKLMRKNVQVVLDRSGYITYMAEDGQQGLSMVKAKNPDIIYTVEGDSFFFPYLYHRAKECNISREINLGRDAVQRKRPVKQAKSYFSSGSSGFLSQADCRYFPASS